MDRDRDDVERVRAGQTERYRELVRRHQRWVAAMMWRFTRDVREHEELVQDVFVEAYCHLDGYRARAPWSHWLSRIAVRVGLRYWRRRARRPLQLDESFWQRLHDPSDRIDAVEAADLLFGLLAQLSPRDRLVLTLRYLDQLSVAETAQRTGWSEAMVKIQTHRAKKRLQRLLREVGL